MCLNKLLIDDNIALLSAVEVGRRAFQFMHRQVRGKMEVQFLKLRMVGLAPNYTKHIFRVVSSFNCN